MKRHLPLLLLVLVAVVLPSPADAAACSGSSGVTVVVRFPDRTETGCAAGNPSTGYQALEGAGFGPLTLAQGSGAGALCRIRGVPQNANCGAMPPANNYWSYWHAKPGGSWSYSSIGGGSYDPAPGSVEGWVLGDGRSKPSATAPGAPSPTPTVTKKPTPKPTPKPTQEPTTGATAPGGPAVPGTTDTPVATATGPTASASAGTSSPSASPTATSTSTPLAEQSAAAAAPTAAVVDPDDGGSLSWLWGVGLVGLLAAAAGAASVRRRQVK